MNHQSCLGPTTRPGPSSTVNKYKKQIHYISAKDHPHFEMASSRNLRGPLLSLILLIGHRKHALSGPSPILHPLPWHKSHTPKCYCSFYFALMLQSLPCRPPSLQPESNSYTGQVLVRYLLPPFPFPRTNMSTNTAFTNKTSRGRQSSRGLLPFILVIRNPPAAQPVYHRPTSSTPQFSSYCLISSASLLASAT